MNKIIYKIEILGWEKYNKKSTKNMPSIMISKRFFDDVKIQTLPPSGKLLYLFLLLRRGDVDATLFECSHDDCVTSAGGRGVVVSTLLDQLQSFQLLRYEKTSLNRIEKNRIEIKRKEGKGIQIEGVLEKHPPPKILNFHEMIFLWNSVVKKLPKVLKSNSTRDAKIKAIWGQLQPDEWRTVFEKIESSDFCCGFNDRGWKASFDWILQKETYLKVLEGKYENREVRELTKTDKKNLKLADMLERIDKGEL